MDLEVLCKSLQETTDKDSIVEILTDIKNTVARVGITHCNVQKFFGYLDDELKSKESQIILAVNDILLEVVNCETPEVEPQFPVLFQSLIAHFEDSEIKVRETSLNVILQYIRRTRNIENVLIHYNKHGINNPKPIVRRKCIKYLPVIIEAEKNVFNSQLGVHELRKTIENLILHLKDESDLVQQEAEKTLWILWKSYKTFEKIVTKLAVEHQVTFEKRITIEFERQAKVDPEKAKRKLSLKNIPEVQRIFRLDAGLFEMKEEELSASPQKKKILAPVANDWPISKNGLHFGFITSAEMKGLTNQEEWKKRLESITSVEEKIMSFREFFDLNAYLTSFVNFLKTMLGETHQPILISIYAILSRILDITGSKNKIALHSLLPELIPKLGDNRVTVRQECLLVCAQVCQMMKLEVALAVLMKYLDDDQNWHTKEEILKLIIVSYLKTHSEGKIEFNQELILSKIAPLVDDENSKVRLGALETLTVICHATNTTQSLEILERLVDIDAYEVVIDGLTEGKVAYVGDNKVMDFTREKYQYLLERQKERHDNRLLLEVGSKDAQILGQNKDMDFDWEQFVIQDDEEGLDSSKIGAEAAGELVKDPKLDLKRRLKAGLRGKHTYQQKHFVKVVDINTGEYQDYQFQGKGKNDAGMVLFTKDIPEDVLKTLREEDEEEEEDKQEEHKEEEPVEEEKPPEDKDKDPQTILDEIFDNGQPMEKEELKKDKKKMLGELKHVKRKKKNKIELYQEQLKDPQEELLLPDESLKPLSFPEFYLENIILDLRIDEWSLQFGALNNLRRVCLYSHEALYSQKFSVHNMIKHLLTVFRKSDVPIVLRNILLGLKHLFERLGKVIDLDIDEIINVLLTKLLKEEVTQRTFMELKYCLGAFIQHLSEDRITFALGKFLTENNKPGQIMVVLCIEKIIKKTPLNFLYNKGSGSLLHYLLKEMSSKEYEVRLVARRTFLKFIECGFERKKLERFFSETATGPDFQRITEFMRRTDEFMAKREKLPLNYS